MNNRGQTMGIAVLSAFVIFIIGIASINLLLNDVSTARIDLGCADASSISDGTKFLCLIVDTTIPYFIWLVFSIAVGAVIARMSIR